MMKASTEDTAEQSSDKPELVAAKNAAKKDGKLSMYSWFVLALILAIRICY